MNAMSRWAVVLVVASACARSSTADDDLRTASSLDPEGAWRLRAAWLGSETFRPEDDIALREQLAADPRDLRTRLRLLGHADAFGHDAEVRRLLLGFIEQHARDPVGDFAGQLAVEEGEATWGEAAAAWRRLVASNPADAV